MSDKHDSAVTRPGGDEGSLVISDNRRMLGIFPSAPCPSILALRLSCRHQPEHPITASLSSELEKAALASFPGALGLLPGKAEQIFKVVEFV